MTKQKVDACKSALKQIKQIKHDNIDFKNKFVRIKIKNNGD